MVTTILALCHCVMSAPLSLPQGCINDTRDALERLGYIVGGIGIAFGIIQVGTNWNTALPQPSVESMFYDVTVT